MLIALATIALTYGAFLRICADGAAVQADRKRTAHRLTSAAHAYRR